MRNKTRSRGGNSIVVRADRANTTAYTVGDVCNFAGYWHYCVHPGTSAAAEPTVIAPLGSGDLVTNGGFDADTDWTKVLTATISGGVGNFAASNDQLRQNIAQINTGETAMFKFTQGGDAGAKAAPALGIFDDLGIGVAGNGQKTIFITATAPRTAINMQAQTVTSPPLTIDNLTVNNVTLDGTCAWKTMGGYIF